MKLSFCIPTYNRSLFLKKNIDIIIKQINELSVCNDVEILINDNASLDDTRIICEKLIEDNPNIHIEYHRNDDNLGPDWNFVKAMQLAHGDYSILHGDDDFLKDGALKSFLHLLNEPGISVYLSNRICIDTNGNIIEEQKMLDVPHEQYVFDFSDEDSLRSFFCGIKGLRSVMSFISSVIYRTDIIKKHEFKPQIIGTNYAFLYYWWSELLGGEKLLYLNQSLVESTTGGSTNNNYGDKVERALVDYNGIIKIADLITTDEAIKQYFYKAINAAHSLSSLVDLCIRDHKNFIEKMIPVLKYTGRNEFDIQMLLSISSLKWMLKVFYYKLFSK